MRRTLAGIGSPAQAARNLLKRRHAAICRVTSTEDLSAPADTTPVPSALTLTRWDRSIRFIREVPSRSRTWTLDKSQFPLQDRHFVLSTTRVAAIRAKHLG